MLENLLAVHQTKIRTQISLTKPLKRAIQIKSRLLGESLSEYLRKAALIRLLTEENEKMELEALAQNFVGAGQWKKDHPHWKSKQVTKKWLRKIRGEWD